MADAPAARTQVVYNDVAYDVATLPDRKSAVVIEQKNQVLGAVKLDKLVNNLAITGDLIYLAYSATPPKYGELRAQIDTLHLEFGDICGESVTELGNIMSASQEVGRKLETAFSLLYDAEEAVAMDMLSDCAADAAQLATAAGRLAEKFDKLCTMADKALSESNLKVGDEIKARDELKRTKNELMAKQARLTELQEKLAKLVSELKTEYNDAKGDLKTTEDRAFALAIVGAIMQPLGQAIGGAATAVGMYYTSRAMPPAIPGLTGGGGGGSQPGTSTQAPSAPVAPPATVSDEDKRKFEQCKAALETAKLDLKALEDDQEILEATIEVKTKRRDALAEREKDPARRRGQEESLTAEIGKAQRDLDTTKSMKGDARTAVDNRQKEFDAIKTAIEKLGVAVSAAGEKFSSMSNDYIKIAENQRERVKELFKVLLEKQDAEREILGEVKEVALRLENISTSVDSAEVTISALFQVVAAMKQVVAILHEARLFWQNMSKACEELANPAFKTQIETYAKKYPKLDRVKMFYDRTSFKEMLLKYLAKWRALEVIAEEYIEATKGVRSTVVDNFKILLVGQAAKDKVKELSARLLGQVANDIEALNDESKVVTEAMKAA